MSLKELQNFPFFWNNRRDPECIRALVDVLWHGSVSIFVVGSLLMVAYGGWLLWNASFITAHDSLVPPQLQTVSREQLTNTLEVFDARSAQYQALLLGIDPIRDPKIK